MANDKYITATAARQDFFNLVEKVKKAFAPVEITIKGIPEAVLMSKEYYDGMLATMETLSDPELVKAIERGIADYKAGRFRPWEDLKQEMHGGNYLVADKGKKYNSSYVSHPTSKRSRKGSKKAR